MAELNLIPEDTKNYAADVLKIAATGAIIAGGMVAPNMYKLLAMKWGAHEPKKTLRAIRYAKENGWLTFRDTDKGLEVALTEAGRLKWQRVQLSEPLTSDTWDGKWRIVLFDIPIKQRYNANEFRKGLQTLGLKQLQRSVWITPYSCQTEIALLRQFNDIKVSVRIMEVLAVDDEQSLKSMFNL